MYIDSLLYSRLLVFCHAFLIFDYDRVRSDNMNNSNIYYYNYLNQFEQILNRMKNRMLNSNWSGNITKDFIVCMIPHHEAAIQMCENLLRYTRN